MKTFKKVLLIIIAICVAMSILIIAIGSDDDTTTADEHIYDSAEIIDLINGSGTSSIGTQSIITMSSEDVTEDDLNDWYYNYVLDGEYTNYFIVYSDKDGYGIQAIEPCVYVDVELEINSNGNYSETSMDEATTYISNSDEQILEIDE